MLALRFNTTALDEMFNLANDFESAFSGSTEAGQRRSAWTPAVEIHETDSWSAWLSSSPALTPGT